MEFVAEEASSATGNLAGRGMGTTAGRLRLLSTTALTATAFAGLVLAAPVFTAGEALAQQLFWDGGHGTWDTATSNWDTALGGGADSLWIDNSMAVFRAGGYIVTVAAGTRVVNGVRFGDNFVVNGPGAIGLGIANTQFSVSAGSTATIDAVIEDATGTSLRKTSDGTLTLSGANTYTGGTIMSAGALRLTGAGTLGATTGATTLDGGGTLDLGGTSQTQSTVTLLSAQIAGNGGTFNATTSFSQTGGTLGGAGTLAINTPTYQLAAGGLVTSSTTIIATTAFGMQAGTVSGVLTGAGALTKTTIGTLTLTNANSYTGGTTINEGTVAISNASALGTGNVTFNGGTLLGTANVTLAPLDFIWSAGTSSTVAAATGTTLTLAPADDYVRGGGGSVLRFGATGQAGTVQLDQAGIGTAGSPQIVLDEGTVRVNGAIVGGVFFSAVGQVSSVAVDDGSALDMNGFDTAVRNLQDGVNGGGTITNGNAAAATLTADNNVPTDFSGTIQDGAGQVSLTKTGGGTLTLSGANAYSGGTTISAGTLAVTNASALGTGNVTFNGGTLLGTADATLAPVNFGWSGGTSGTVAGATGATLTLDPGNYARAAGSVVRFGAAGQAGTVQLDEASIGGGANVQIFLDEGTVRVNGATVASSFFGGGLGLVSSVAVDDGSTLDINGFDTQVRNLQDGVNGGGTITSDGAVATLIADNNVASSFSGTIQDGAGQVSLTKVGVGALTLAGTNTYTGTTTVNAGTLALAGGTAIADSGAVVVNAGTLRLDDNEIIGSLEGTAGAVVDLGPDQLTTGGNDGTTTFAGNVTGLAASTLLKEGDGAFLLSGTVNTAGSLAVNAGTLALSGNHTISGGITVDDGTLRL